MPLIDECPFFTINWNILEEPYQSSGYGLGIENSIQDVQQSLCGSGFNGGNIPEFLQSAIDKSELAKQNLSSWGSSDCSIETNFDDIKKAHFNSFVSFLRAKFERYKILCNYQIDGRWGNQPCKKIALKYEFDFLNNDFSFTINQLSDSELIDSEKIEEVFNLETFSGSIYYEFYVKPEVICELPDGLIDKINYLYDKTHEIADKTEE